MMDLEEKKVEKSWYDKPNAVTWLIIIVISFIILSSQSFAINSDVDALKIFQDVLNHNITYMIALVYFILIKTKFGRKYFDYENFIMIVIFFIVLITSFLTVFQSFSLPTLLSLAINFVVFIYFFHTFMRPTIIWKEFKLEKSPFNELSNLGCFQILVVLEVILLLTNLILMQTFDGTVLATLACVYMLLFARYIYLFRAFLEENDEKKKEKKALKESE